MSSATNLFCALLMVKYTRITKGLNPHLTHIPDQKHPRWLSKTLPYSNNEIADGTLTQSVQVFSLRLYNIGILQTIADCADMMDGLNLRCSRKLYILQIFQRARHRYGAPFYFKSLQINSIFEERIFRQP